MSRAVVGDSDLLGSWSTSGAIALSAAQYTNSNPLWTGAVNLPAGSTFQYKFIKVGTDGGVVWESDPNRSFTVPAGCDKAVSVNASWR